MGPCSASDPVLPAAVGAEPGELWIVACPTDPFRSPAMKSPPRCSKHWLADDAGANIDRAPMFDATVSRGDPLYHGKGPERSVSGSTGRRRFREEGIPLHAALYVVAVSDEDDASCSPMVQQPICTADPGCRCAPDGTLSGAGAYGSTGYFSRFIETYKGFGNEDMVAFAAIVALDGSSDAGVPSQFGDPNQHVGCCRSSTGGPCPTSGSAAAVPRFATG